MEVIKVFGRKNTRFGLTYYTLQLFNIFWNTITGECKCDNKIIDGFGNCQKSYSKNGRSGPICYVPRLNSCSRSFEGNNGWYSWDPCSNSGGFVIGEEGNSFGGFSMTF